MPDPEVSTQGLPPSYNVPFFRQRGLWPWLAMLAVAVVAVIQLRSQGRLWWCSCGQGFLWAGNIWSALDYQGDSIANSLGDILCCGLGFALAHRLTFWASLGLFLVTEAVLLFWIRDDLLLNVVMLIFPIDAIKAWQMGL